MMKRSVHVLMIAMALIFMGGCMSAQGRPDYTASGALAGGATGAIIGSMARHRGPAALVGGAVGALVGGLVGHDMDQAQEARLSAQAPQTLQRVQQSQPLTVPDIKALARARISDELIISQIRNSRTVYHLTTADIIDLKNAGVSERVIDFMINTPTQIPSAEVAAVVGPAPPAPAPEVVPVAPGPGYIWVAGAYFWGGSRWVWHPGYWHRSVYHYGYGRHWR